MLFIDNSALSTGLS